MDESEENVLPPAKRAKGTKRDRSKQSTFQYKKRKGFGGAKTVNIGTINNDINVNSDSGAPTNTGGSPANETVNIVNTPPTSSAVNTSQQSESLPALDKIERIVSETPKQQHKISGYRIMDMDILANIFSTVLCPECENPSLSLIDRVSCKKGMASLLLLKCSRLNCDFTKEFYTSANSGEKSFDVNNRIVYTMRLLGNGHAGIQKFTHLMDMPKPMTKKNYEKIADKIGEVAKEVAEQSMNEATEELRKDKRSDEIVDIGVSCDGTWQKRGFQSLNGVFAAISIESGKVIDIEAMNRSCKSCILKEPLRKSNPDVFAEWRNSHVCKRNYQGSAGGMESVGAKRVFERSIEKYKMRYVNFLGDGDSKSYSTVKDTYPTIEVKKLECVGHYQKRLGTRLRNLKKREKALGGRGKLTDAVIDRLQNFFGLAIRQNSGNLIEMKKAVLASLFHVASSKDNNFHFPHCPTGPDSWCKFNADAANKTSEYKPGPGLPVNNIIHKIKPVYQVLSKDSELAKCLHGKTQNVNESFNGLIWERVPKTEYVSLSRLKFGVYDAVGHFNMGMKSSILIYEKLGMVPGCYALKGCSKINEKRVRKCLYRNDRVNKLKRQSLRAKKHKAVDKINETELPMYVPGGF